tara:strand:+ start:2240 stop:2527 length:288 start_codon:yes stop_codon:yes gene_type:complete
MPTQQQKNALDQGLITKRQYDKLPSKLLDGIIKAKRGVDKRGESIKKTMTVKPVKKAPAKKAPAKKAPAKKAPMKLVPKKKAPLRRRKPSEKVKR